MKVAVICPDDLSIVLFCKGIVQVLKDWDNSQVLVISDYWSEDEDGFYIKTIKSWGVEHVYLRTTRYITPLQDIRYVYNLWRILKRNKIDTVINITTKPNILGTFAGRLAGVRNILCSVWGRGSVFVEGPGLKKNLRKSFILWLYRLAFGLSSKIWFTNESDLNYFLARNVTQKRKTILTKNYVNTDDYFPYELSRERALALKREIGLQEQDRMVIMVGRMIWAKGVREFVEASKILKEKLPFVKFVLVGPKEEGIEDAVPESYMKESEKLGNFIWPGFRKDVKDLYVLADLAVLPSYYKEGGFPRALTEPMAMGKPVIAADTPDCRGPVEHGENGYLVPAKDSDALANAIEILMNDDNKRKEFGHYSRIKAVNEFDEKAIVQQVIKEFFLA